MTQRRSHWLLLKLITSSEADAQLWSPYKANYKANISTDRKTLIRAGQGLVAFARQWSMKLIAGSGKVTVQAQDGEMEIGASKNVHVYSLETLLMQAKKIVLRIKNQLWTRYLLFLQPHAACH